ncbi:hypothetical protein B0H17DRAFT_1124220 [Mycena rosella]|uniref:Uncharacterized protein n=1 Tax=Mycena rosella TaxID=1033263 RepID=A0AAD7H0W1_MYCRO|nr:hypothetical protein B0H17DRAFT_1124220 [Mycena rosella]
MPVDACPRLPLLCSESTARLASPTRRHTRRPTRRELTVDQAGALVIFFILASVGSSRLHPSLLIGAIDHNIWNAPGSPLQHTRGTATAGRRFARANLLSPLRPLSNMLLDRPARPYPPSSFAALATLRPSGAPQVANCARRFACGGSSATVRLQQFGRDAFSPEKVLWGYCREYFYATFRPHRAALAAKDWQKRMRWGEYPKGNLPQGCSGGVRWTPASAIIPIVSTLC